MPSKNTFDVCGDIIYISRPEWDFVARASVRDDYLEEIQSVTWGLSNKRYPFNAKLGYLHSYIMRKWYGDEMCDKMKEAGFVIDHMDNDSANSNIKNLWFLSNDENKAKGMTVDKMSSDHRFIALSMSKDFNTELFQITIVFNYPAKINIGGLDKPATAELVCLLYDCDYELVVNDAHGILLEYKKDYSFSLNSLRMVDYHIEGCYGIPISVEEYLERKFAPGKAVVLFDKKAPIENWTLDKKKKYISFSDI